MAQASTVPAPAVLGQLGRLLASRDFDASPRGRALLRFMVGETLAGRQEKLNLTSVARQVFRRGEDFDSGLDPAVRIEVSQLRRALDRYCQRAGDGDPVCITLPRDACVPVARWVSGGRAATAARF